MAFTNERLKQFKETMAIAKDYAYIFHKKDIEPLIARLEAGEKALEFYIDEKQIVSGKMLEDALEAWRKAAGKD